MFLLNPRKTPQLFRVFYSFAETKTTQHLHRTLKTRSTKTLGGSNLWTVKTAVISMLIEHYAGDVPGAVVALGGMLDPPITITTGASEVGERRRLRITAQGEPRSRAFSQKKWSFWACHVLSVKFALG